MKDETEYGVVYFDESDQRYHYHCKWCSTSFSGTDDLRIDDKADAHELECTSNSRK